jgi:hypothetical protein
MKNELDLQSTCRKILRNLGIKYIYHGKTHKTFYDNDKNLKGQPDLIIFYEGKTLFIEFKSKNGLLSDCQIEWQIYLEYNKFKYYIVKNIETFNIILNINKIGHIL